MMKAEFPRTHDAHWYERRRHILQQQTLTILRQQQETAGQLTLPIFGQPTEPELLKKVVSERERVSWAWRNKA